MQVSNLLQSFALDKDGQVVAIEDAERGQACGCRCPACGSPVIARKGDVRIWHFAHDSGIECSGAGETALHLAAKEVIRKRSGLMLPGIAVREEAHLPGGRFAAGEACLPPIWVDFDHVCLEPSVGTIRPDILATSGSGQLIVEVAVHHFVDSDKRDQIVAMGIPAVEIDLAALSLTRWGWQELERIVIDATEAKSWIYNPDHRLLSDEALVTARTNAAKLPLPITHISESWARLTIQGMIVDVRDYPFGVTVWSSYHPDVSPLIGRIARRFGGRWKPQYRNWLVPASAKAHLINALQNAALPAS